MGAKIYLLYGAERGIKYGVSRAIGVFSNPNYASYFHGIGFQLGKNKTSEIVDFIINRKTPLICLNDYKGLRGDITPIKNEINAAFELILPDKSAFEL